MMHLSLYIQMNDWPYLLFFVLSKISLQLLLQSASALGIMTSVDLYVLSNVIELFFRR